MFDEDAELYDRARPGYPPALFDDLAKLGCIGPGCSVLEIGCGTGQATLPLAERGCSVICVELGPGMARVARRKLAGYPGVRVDLVAFEDWPLPPEPFDTVLSATAFHWIDPRIRVSKAADALRPGGMLATIATHHVLGGDVEFFAQVQECYERWDPATPPGLRLQPPSEIPLDRDEVDRSGRFEPAVFHRYEWDLGYTTEAYINTLLTYSGHRALPDADRHGLLTCIEDLINHGYGGRITKRYMSELRLSRRPFTTSR